MKETIIRTLIIATVLALVGLSSTSACPSPTPSAAPSSTTQASSGPSWMHFDASKKTASFDIGMATNGNNGTFNFNGYGRGDMTITVPLGWKVHMHVTNKGYGAIPHSLEVVAPSETVPQQAVTPAFPQAETINLVPGMSVGQSDNVDFVANKEGKYWIMCGVPNHAIGGMWDWFIVSKSADVPSVTFKSS
jgi:sulfocyanin